MKFGLYGAGNLGLSLAVAIQKAGENFAGVYDVNPDAALRGSELLQCPILSGDSLAEKCNVLMLAVPDDQIETVFLGIRKHIQPDTILVHFSGALPSEILDTPLRLSAHPAQTFPYPRLEEEAFKDIPFALEGNPQALKLFSPIIGQIGAKPFTITADIKPLYHTMCVMASNLVLGLLKSAEDIGKSLNLKEIEALEIILRLANNAISDASNAHSLDKALSGPVIRGDVKTVEENLKNLQSYPSKLELYRLLSLEVLRLARKAGLSSNKAREIENRLLLR